MVLAWTIRCRSYSSRHQNSQETGSSTLLSTESRSATVFLTISTVWTKKDINTINTAGLSEDSWSLPLLPRLPLDTPLANYKKDVSQTSNACQWGMNAMNSLGRQRDKILRHWGHSWYILAKNFQIFKFSEYGQFVPYCTAYRLTGSSLPYGTAVP